MGEVYRARDTKLGRDVAIKILPAAFALDADRLARFEREARVLASLNHPHIAQIYGLEDNGGVPAIVMELVAGDTLADRIARGPLRVADALAIARQIADALDAAHERGIVHRDLKPLNVALTADNVAKVLDFGLAKDGASGPPMDLTHSPTAPGATFEGVLLGTAPYMSPEQARGKVVDKRTDIWAFGCVLFEMLTGQPAFRGETTTDVIAQIVERDPDWTLLPAALPPSLRRVLQGCFEKDVRRRIRDIGDVRRDLDDRVELPPTPASRTALAWPAAAVIAVAAAAVLWILRGPGADTGPRITRAIRLTNTPAEEFGAMLSPDSKWVTYYSNAGERTDLWVRYLDSGATLNLTSAIDLELQVRAGLGGLDVSPDGGSIAFTARQPSSANTAFDTWIVPAPLGGAPRKLLTGLTATRWSPDGKRVVAMRAGASLGDALYVANADGSDLKIILPLSAGRHIHFPAWSDDGRYIYYIHSYITWHDEPSQIYRVAADGGVPEPVIQTERRAIYPVPMPAGGLVYASNPFSVEAGLWWQSAPGAPLRPLTSGIGEHSEARVSADGRHLVATYSSMRQSLVRLPVDGPAAGKPQPVTDGYTGDLYPSIHAASGRMVFSSSRGGGRNIWIANLDGSRALPLTTENVIDERPVFSADGQRIAFLSDRGGRRGIWVINADGGAPRLVGRADVLDTLTWSPDGTQILFATPGESLPTLAAMAVDNGLVKPFPTPAAAHSPAWSPVTNEIAYLEPSKPTETTPSRTYLAFVDPQGKPLHVNVPKSGTAFQNGFLAWSPDGRRVAVASVQAGTNAYLYVADLRSAEIFRLIQKMPVSVRPRGVTWTPDGSNVVIAEQRSDADIVLFDLEGVARR